MSKFKTIGDCQNMLQGVKAALFVDDPPPYVTPLPGKLEPWQKDLCNDLLLFRQIIDREKFILFFAE